MNSREQAKSQPTLEGDDIRFTIAIIKASAKHAEKDKPRPPKATNEPLHWNARPPAPEPITEDSQRFLSQPAIRGLDYALGRFIDGEFKIPEEDRVVNSQETRNALHGNEISLEKPLERAERIRERLLRMQEIYQQNELVAAISSKRAARVIVWATNLLFPHQS